MSGSTFGAELDYILSRTMLHYRLLKSVGKYWSYETSLSYPRLPSMHTSTWSLHRLVPSHSANLLLAPYLTFLYTIALKQSRTKFDGTLDPCFTNVMVKVE